jgi:hypothetical protein
VRIRRVPVAIGFLAVLTVALLFGPELVARLREPKPPVSSISSDSLARHPALGCWEFKGIDWGTLVGVPERARFDSAPLSHRGTSVARRLVIEPTARAAPMGAIYWAPYSDMKDVYVAWGDGLAGVQARLRYRRDSLVGTAIGWYDIGGPWVAGKLLGVRGGCPRDSIPAYRLRG